MKPIIIDQQMMLKALWETICKEQQVEDNRERPNVIWKHAFSVAVLEQTTLPLQKIGYIMGKNHATILHAKKQHESNYRFDATYRQCYEVVSKEITAIIDEYDEEVKKAIRTRSTIINPSIDKLEREYHKKLAYQKRQALDNYNKLEDKYRSVMKEMRMQKARAEKLNEEVKRLKNLL